MLTNDAIVTWQAKWSFKEEHAIAAAEPCQDPDFFVLITRLLEPFCYLSDWMIHRIKVA
jgi:hypothetical protein